MLLIKQAIFYIVLFFSSSSLLSMEKIDPQKEKFKKNAIKGSGFYIGSAGLLVVAPVLALTGFSFPIIGTGGALAFCGGCLPCFIYAECAECKIERKELQDTDGPEHSLMEHS